MSARSFAIEPYDSHTTPKARIPHKCCECWGEIPVGEIYHRRNGRRKDNYTWDYKTCAPCEAIYLEVCAELPADLHPVIGQLSLALTRNHPHPRMQAWRASFMANQRSRRPAQ